MYEVLVTPQAEQEVDEITRYIAEELKNPQAATELHQELLTNILSLEEMPGRYPLCDDQFLRSRGYRRFEVGRCIVVYRYDAECVYIVHVYHELQNYSVYLINELER